MYVFLALIVDSPYNLGIRRTQRLEVSLANTKLVWLVHSWVHSMLHNHYRLADNSLGSHSIIIIIHLDTGVWNKGKIKSLTNQASHQKTFNDVQ